jgi:hypothetical protein
MIKEIKNTQDVAAFFTYLVEVEKLNFHPDESFDQYVNLDTKEQSYTVEECTVRDKLMEKCFLVCENADIYEIANNSHLALS